MIIGIDYSLTSPAVCVKEGEQISLFSFGKKKMQGIYKKDNFTIHIEEYPEWSEENERYEKLAEWTLSKFKDPSLVIVEGYSYGSKGQVFNLAENCGIMKHKMWQLGYSFITPAPSAVKKVATGKGNANKEKMYEAFSEKVGWDLKDLLGDVTAGYGNPVSDLIDAYYMAIYGVAQDCDSKE